jgi:G8 domain
MGAPLIRSVHSGRWSDPTTWDGGRIPGQGVRVKVQTGHVVVYDIVGDTIIRSIHVAGTLRFDPERDTRLDVGLIKIQAGEDPAESGFDCESHTIVAPGPGTARAALEVGTADGPVAAGRTAVIRLTAVDGLDPEECPAIVCCGGRMEFHGAELGRTWVKLAAAADKGATGLVLAEPVPGWRAGDRVIITATSRQPLPKGPARDAAPTVPETEERIIRAIDGPRLTLDKPLEFPHIVRGETRGEVALLSRNVVVESADPTVTRGHTMYHRHSSGSISYAEFRHLGKAGRLGKYSLHFHRVGDTMRGASVIGASIWDSGNRWITIHGTNGLVVQDCVGYRSVGHGFFLEDGTEVDNILDGNLAVRAGRGTRLPDQALAFDRNEGAGFWWANSQNAFVRNVAVECDQYGFRYEAPAVPGFDPSMSIRSPDGTKRRVDIRTLPFLRFDDNEAHAQRGYGLDLGGGPGDGAIGGVGGVGPDARHPYVIRRLRVWDAHWALTLDPPDVLVDGLQVTNCEFGLWRPRYERHAYREMKFHRTGWIYFAETGQRPGPKDYPGPLEPIDDRPPFTVITQVGRFDGGKVRVRGVSVDDGSVRSVRVNGHPARPLVSDYSRWEVTIDLDRLQHRPITLSAAAEDHAGHLEPIPHQVEIVVPQPERHSE